MDIIKHSEPQELLSLQFQLNGEAKFAYADLHKLCMHKAAAPSVGYSWVSAICINMAELIINDWKYKFWLG
jgi:hypothetical protein